MIIVGTLGDRRTIVPQPGYPKITLTEGDLTIRERYFMSKDELKYLPEIGDAYRDDIPLRSDIEKLVLDEISTEPRSSDGPWVVDLLWKPEPLYDDVSGRGQNRIMKTYELSTEDQDVPLEQHPAYRTCWNYILIGRNGVGLEVPAWWATATNVKVAGDGTSYQWIKPGGLISDGWRIICQEIKPGVESYRSGVVRVIVTKTCLRRGPLQDEARRQDYTTGSPGITFGYNVSWLRGGSNIRRQGKKWELQVSYIGVHIIDEDLYHA